MTAGEMMVVAGLDWGASAIKMSRLMNDGKVVRVEDSSGNYFFDSSVYVKSATDVVFGEHARQLGFEDPANFIDDLKARRGTGKVHHGLSVADIHAMDLMKRVLPAHVEQFGDRPTCVVATTPCSAGDAQIADLVAACERAGLRVVGTIPEPCAVAIAAAEEKLYKLVPGQIIVVFDTGHLTCDFAVLRFEEDGSFTVLRADGVFAHAGRKLHEMVAEHVLAQASKLTGVKVTLADLTPEQRYAFLVEILKAVRALNARPSVTVGVPVAKKIVGIELKTPAFKEIIDQFLKPLIEALNKLLAAAGVDAKSVIVLLLSGGLALNGLFRDRVAAVVDIKVTRVPEPLDACARGAVRHAQTLARRCLPEATRELPPAEAKVTLCTTHTIASVVADRGPSGERISVCALLVGEGEPIPLKGHKNYALIYADQPDVTIEIVRGKDGQSPHQCAKFAKLVLQNLPPEKVKSPRIRVDYSISERNLCQVTATDLVGGATQMVSFEINKEGGR